MAGEEFDRAREAAKDEAVLQDQAEAARLGERIALAKGGMEALRRLAVLTKHGEVQISEVAP